MGGRSPDEHLFSPHSVEGGVYTDTDTSCLKAIDQWGRNPRLVLPDHPRSKGEPRVIIGVEADVGTREDWNDVNCCPHPSC